MSRCCYNILRYVLLKGDLNEISKYSSFCVNDISSKMTEFLSKMFNILSEIFFRNTYNENFKKGRIGNHSLKNEWKGKGGWGGGFVCCRWCSKESNKSKIPVQLKIQNHNLNNFKIPVLIYLNWDFGFISTIPPLYK